MRRGSHRGVALAVALTAAAGACGDGGSPPGDPASVTTDSAGVTVVDNRRAQAPTPWTVGPARPVPSTGGPPEWYGVADAVRTGSGTLVIAEAGTPRITFVGGDGRIRSRLDRDGDGPGEFRLPQRLGAAAGDSVWVYDFAGARLTFLGPDGGAGRVVTLRPPVASGVVVGRLDDGGWIVAGQWGAGAGARREGRVREDVPVVRYSSDGVALDTLGLVPGREVYLTAENGRTVMSAAPFARTAAHVVSGGRVWIGDQVAPELRVLRSDGRAERVVRWRVGPLDVRPAEIEAWIDDRLASVPPDRRPGARATMEAAPMPALRPAFGSLLAAPGGGVWVGPPPGQPEAGWQVFDSLGTWRATVVLPGDFTPLWIDADGVLGVSVDTLGVERVEERPLAH